MKCMAIPPSSATNPHGVSCTKRKVLPSWTRSSKRYSLGNEPIITTINSRDVSFRVVLPRPLTVIGPPCAVRLESTTLLGTRTTVQSLTKRICQSSRVEQNRRNRQFWTAHAILIGPSFQPRGPSSSCMHLRTWARISYPALLLWPWRSSHLCHRHHRRVRHPSSSWWWSKAMNYIRIGASTRDSNPPLSSSQISTRVKRQRANSRRSLSSQGKCFASHLCHPLFERLSC